MVRVTRTLECDNLINLLAVLVDGVKKRNVHSVITSRKTLWGQVSSAGPKATLSRRNASTYARLPTFTGEEGFQVTSAAGPEPLAECYKGLLETHTPNKTEETAEHHGLTETADKAHKDPA